MLGTWSDDAVEPDATYGVGTPEPESAIAMQVDGWRRVTALSSERVGEALDVADRGREHVGHGRGEDAGRRRGTCR